ncbi:protein RRP5 homolog [Planococcus citri]|uniref:protein RRP5 homolog n=1 Tax=Planococcus citri TaxID=170843 RepID=UPI0031F88A95
MPPAKKSIKKQKHLPHLELEDDSFDWSSKPLSIEQNDPVTSSSEDEEETEKKRKGISKKEAKKEQLLAEKRLREKEEELLNLDENPQTSDQFDRLLLGSPNDSKLWIKYMAFHLQNTEFERVRSTARRALQTIDSRKEQEILNIWISLLNFENLYGTKESLNKCFEEAARVCDEYQIYSKMLDIYVASNKSKEAEQLAHKITKKFKYSMDSWLHCCECLFKIKDNTKARFTLQRGLTSLAKKEHVSFISRFALLEHKYGFPQEAQTLFEHILTSYPARVDIWSCYVDLLVKSNSIDIARNVLERACSLKLPAKKMKTLFTKRIAFEERFGDESAVQNVKKEAQNYVSNYAKVF